MAHTAYGLLGKDAFEFNREELRSVVILVSACEKLVRHGNTLDTQSEKGCAGCQRFLRALEKLAVTLRLERAPREYRAKFTPNFRALFSGEDRSYRVDILEAAMSLMPALWANGEAHELGEAAVDRAKTLREAWYDFHDMLDQWTSQEHVQGQAKARRVICQRLERLDSAWACFEEAYVEELLLVQQRARSVLAEAAAQEHSLRATERESGSQRTEAAWEAHRQEEVALLEHLGHLSAAIGTNPKPSSQVPELSVQIYDDAMQVLAITGFGGMPRTSDPAVVMAERAVECFKDMRDYLGKVHDHMDEVHPQLCRNPGLAARLARWEESWDRSSYYVHNPLLLEGVRHLVSFLGLVIQIVPHLQQMFEDCDAELFLVLPRLVCLNLLSDPDGPVAPIAQSLLPNRYAVTGAPAGNHKPDGGSSGQVFAAAATLTNVLELLQAGMKEFDEEDEEVDAWNVAWEVLLQRAVVGAGAEGPEDPYSELDPGWRESAVAAVESMMHEVEGWSMELQRHRPEAWNDLSDLLVQCMVWTPDKPERPPSKFVI